MGSRPVASKLLFAPAPPGSDDNIDSFELYPAHPTFETRDGIPSTYSRYDVTTCSCYPLRADFYMQNTRYIRIDSPDLPVRGCMGRRPSTGFSSSNPLCSLIINQLHSYVFPDLLVCKLRLRTLGSYRTRSVSYERLAQYIPCRIHHNPADNEQPSTPPICETEIPLGEGGERCCAAEVRALIHRCRCELEVVSQSQRAATECMPVESLNLRAQCALF